MPKLLIFAFCFFHQRLAAAACRVENFHSAAGLFAGPGILHLIGLNGDLPGLVEAFDPCPMVAERR